MRSRLPFAPVFRAAMVSGLLASAGSAACVLPPPPATNPGPGSRATLLRARIDRLAAAGLMPSMCFVSDPTPEQLANILGRFNALPPTALFQPRFFSQSLVWAGSASGQGPPGRALPAQLTYSFVPDGTLMINCNTNSLQASNLNAGYAALFGAGNVDRGRELLRQAWAGWRRWAALSYTEVADDGATQDFGPSTPPTRGTVRIGGVPQGNTGILACNYYPAGGADMSINSSYFSGSPGYFTQSASNYRYFRNVVAHEHGHGLGAFHPVPCDHTKLMEPFVNTNFDLQQLDDIRFAQRNFGDRFAGNTDAAHAVDFGDLAAPAARSVIERGLSTNGVAGYAGSDQDWFRFTLSSPQSVAITVQPVGNVYSNGQQTGGCSTDLISTVNALGAGNPDLELRDAGGVSTLLSSNSPAGNAETIAAVLDAGTYFLRVFDAGPNFTENGIGGDQVVQLYDLTVRIGAAKAPPKAIAGINKRCQAGVPCWFMGHVCSYATETGAAVSTFMWDLDGDGSNDSSSTQPTFTYVSNGVFNVTLAVADTTGSGLTGSDTIQVTVFGASGSVSSVTPGTVNPGATVPVSIIGTNLKGVASASQVQISGAGISVTGVPTPNARGTRVTGLSLVVAANAALGPRDITITDCDGQGGTAPGSAKVIVSAPANDECASPAAWPSALGNQAFTNLYCTNSAAPDTTGAGSCSGPVLNDAWYTWVAPQTATISAQTDAAVFGARFAVYSAAACPPGAGGPIACTQANQPAVFGVVSGQTYLFQIGSMMQDLTGPANVALALWTPPPATGACCANSSCSTTTAAQCVGAGTHYAGDGTACNAPGNRVLPCCKADFNQSGLVTVQDVFEFLPAWFSKSAAGDFNGDGLVAVQDVFDFLNAWFAGCP